MAQSGLHLYTLGPKVDILHVLGALELSSISCLNILKVYDSILNTCVDVSLGLYPQG